MAAVDYYGILSALQTILKADARLAGVQVTIEEDPQAGVAGSGKAIVLTLNSRSASSQQSMAAGMRTRFTLDFSAWCVGFDLQSFEKASEKRDDLMGAAELVIMANRKINGTVTSLNLEGGKFLTAKDETGMVFCSLGEVSVSAEVSAINT